MWTNANAGEVLPDVVTPDDVVAGAAAACNLLTGSLRAIGIRIKEEQCVWTDCGPRVFQLQHAVRAGSPHAVGERNRARNIFRGGHQDTMLALKQIRISEADLPG